MKHPDPTTAITLDAGLTSTPTAYLIDFAQPVMHSQRPGMVAGLCGHAVAPSEWRAGLRSCERCPTVTSSLIELLPELRPIEITAVGDAGPLDADSIAMQMHSRIETLLDRLQVGEEEFEVGVDLGRGEVTVVDAVDEDLVLARGVITGPGVGRALADRPAAPMTHIRQIGAARANLCPVEGGEATYPGAATCEDCKAAYATVADA